MTRRPASTRERIITAATGLFRRDGVTGAGIGEICERAGVTKGVFAHHFPRGKDELIVEVVNRNSHDVERLLRAARRSGSSLGRAVEASFGGYAQFLRDKGIDFGCPVAASVVDASASSPEVRAAAGNAFARWARALDDLGSEAADGYGELVVAAFEGAIILARATGDPAVLERLGRALGGLVAGAAPPT